MGNVFMGWDGVCRGLGKKSGEYFEKIRAILWINADTDNNYL